MTPAEIKAALLAEAQRLRFDLCQIARADVPLHAEAFRRWLAEGHHGEMKWLEKNADRRTDPQQVLAGARSVIMLAINYWQPPRPPGAPGKSGRIARYAWGDDYHEVLEPRLWQLDAWLQQHGGRQRQYVDTGPLLERDLAGQAGL